MAESKPWWESDLEWSLEDTIKMGKGLLRSIPQAVAAYKLGKASPVDHIEELPAEKLSGNVAKPPIAQSNPVPPASAAARSEEKSDTKPARPAPRIIPPPPPPPPKPASAARGVNMDQLGIKPAASSIPPKAGAPANTMSDAPATPPVEMPVTYAVPAPSTKLTSQPAPFRMKDPGEITLTRIRKVVVEKKLTLEQLLDPEFCDYSNE